MAKPKILVISFSNIAQDARVLREISAIAQHGEVTSVGYGKKPENSTIHIELPKNAPSLPQTIPGILKLALRMHTRAELSAPGSIAAMKLLEGKKFDLIVANDARAIPLAFKVSQGSPVWADMHEWARGERTQILAWRILIAPLMDHICKKYLPACNAVTTVSGTIAELYQQEYKIKKPLLIRNAPAYIDLPPSQCAKDGKIQLVHSGGAVAGRNIEAMITAVKQLEDRFTLDLYLIPANDGGKYLESLHKLAGDDERIQFHDPVKPDELAKTLNQYDVGIYWMPPVHLNAKLALPNKFFDFVQARLAIAVGPTAEMSALINKYKIGWVSEGFEIESIVSTLNSLTTEKVAAAKQATVPAAKDLNFDNESKVIEDILQDLLGSI
ncbi:MAG: hypothetical protein Q4E03_00485 [Trueperella sp.]|nr:hypothetical protein [Trueperella sp.]